MSINSAKKEGKETVDKIEKLKYFILLKEESITKKTKDKNTNK